MPDRHVTAPPRGLATLTLVTKHFGPDANFSRAATPIPNYSHPRPESGLSFNHGRPQRIDPRPDSWLSFVHARPQRIVGRSSIGSDSSPPGMVPDEDEDYASGDDDDHQYHLSQSRLFDSFWQEGPFEHTTYPALLDSSVSRHCSEKAPSAEPAFHDHDILDSPRSPRLEQDAWPLRPSTSLSTTRPAPKYSLFPQAPKAPRQPAPPPRVASPSPVLPPIASTSELSLSMFGPSESPMSPTSSPTAASSSSCAMSASRPLPHPESSSSVATTSELPLSLPNTAEGLPAPTRPAQSTPIARRFASWEHTCREHHAFVTRSVPVSPYLPEHCRHHSFGHQPFRSARPASAGLPQTSQSRPFSPLSRGRAATYEAPRPHLPVGARVCSYSPFSALSTPTSAAPSPLSSSFSPPATPTTPSELPSPTTSISTQGRPSVGAERLPGEELRSYFDLDDSDDDGSDGSGRQAKTSSKFTFKSIVRNLQHKRSVSDVRRKAKSRDSSKEYSRRGRAATSAADSSPPRTAVSNSDGPDHLTFHDLNFPVPGRETAHKKQGSFAFLLGRLNQ